MERCCDVVSVAHGMFVAGMHVWSLISYSLCFKQAAKQVAGLSEPLRPSSTNSPFSLRAVKPAINTTLSFALFGASTRFVGCILISVLVTESYPPFRR